MTSIRVTFSDGSTRDIRTSDTPDEIRSRYLSERLKLPGRRVFVEAMHILADDNLVDDLRIVRAGSATEAVVSIWPM